MFDFNSLPIPGGIFVAGLTCAVLFGFGLGPMVAKRTIENSGWQRTCEKDLRGSIAAQVPKSLPQHDLSCRDVMNTIGHGADQICSLVGDNLFDLMTLDPLAAQREQLRRQEIKRLARIAEQSPSRCSCAASVVGADRILWGIYAASARLAGGPDDLQSELKQALHAPACARIGSEYRRQEQ